MLEMAEIGPGDHVRSASGYAAAVMSRVVDHVYTIERHATLAEDARRRFQIWDMATASTSCALRWRFPSKEAVRAAVEAGFEATATSASVAASSVEAGLLGQVDFAFPDRSFYVLRHVQRHHGRVAQAFLSLIGGRSGK